jgi:hypothetical protein
MRPVIESQRCPALRLNSSKHASRTQFLDKRADPWSGVHWSPLFLLLGCGTSYAPPLRCLGLPASPLGNPNAITSPLPSGCILYKTEQLYSLALGSQADLTVRYRSAR